MEQKHIELTLSSIDNGRIYFPITDIKFFPVDSLSERDGDGHKGLPVTFVAAEHRFEGPDRVYSGKRLSPQRSFAAYFADVAARPGDTLVVTRAGEREYEVEHRRA